MDGVTERSKEADDTKTLVSTIVGTFVMGDYTREQAEEVWTAVRGEVEGWLAKR
jgi:hypothetical protein